jgi:hypothetical protein
MHRTASILRTAVFIILIYPATKYYGLTGAAFTSLLAMIILFIIMISYAYKIFNLNLYAFFYNLLPGIKASLVIIIPGITLYMIYGKKSIGYLLFGIALCLSAWGYGLYKVVLYGTKTASEPTY